MYSIVSEMRHTNNVLGVHQTGFLSKKIFLRDGGDVMENDSATYRPIRTCYISTVITDNNTSSECSPFIGIIEVLIYEYIEDKGINNNTSRKFQVFETLDKFCKFD